MQNFLSQIAKNYYHKYETQISDFVFVFPNRRSGIFFKKYLTQETQKPIFSPQICTINEFIHQLSSLRLVPRTQLLFKLYAVFKNVTGRDEPFDQFFSWGDILLNDFNDIDSYQVDAQQIFSNISDLKDIDTSFQHLSEEQINLIKRFWSHFVPLPEKENERQFFSLWKQLFDVYKEFRASLVAESIGYEGMILRETAEKIDRNEIIWPYKKIIFIGFNALNKTEKKLFIALKKEGIADFYWDYKSSFFSDRHNKASLFLEENKLLFPSEFELKSYEQKKETFELIGVPSAISQTKQVQEILTELIDKKILLPEDKNQLINTAIVLPDEKLLLPQLHAIPQAINYVNITMGYPLSLSPIHSLIDSFINLHINSAQKNEHTVFYFKHALALLNHPYIYSKNQFNIQNKADEITSKRMFWIQDDFFDNDDFLKTLFTRIENTSELVLGIKNCISLLTHIWQANNREPEQEFMFRYSGLINQIDEQIKLSNLTISIATFKAILNQTVQNTSIPFKGEPLAGIQIIGMLETRSLSFDNLIITSLNEDIFPNKKHTLSLIPYHLRKGFDLPTYEHQDALQSYYFYRLVSAAKRVYLIYDTRSSGVKTGEVSRFIHQLKYHYNVDIHERNAVYNILSQKKEELKIEKDSVIMKKLQAFTTNESLSASNLNDYMECPLRFYFSKISHLRPAPEMIENIEADVFGSIYHQVMENLYRPYLNIEITSIVIEQILHSQRIEEELNKAFSELYLKRKKVEKPQGRHLLTINIIQKYIIATLKFDKTKTPFTCMYLEKTVECLFPLANSQKSVLLKGIIDRIDYKNGAMHLIDYKTGSAISLQFKNTEQLFDKEEKERPKAIFQTFLYAMMWQKIQQKKHCIQPEIYSVRQIFKADYSEKITLKNGFDLSTVTDYNDFNSEFSDKLGMLLTEIFNPNIPFAQCKDEKKCYNCAFANLCQKNNRQTK